MSCAARGRTWLSLLTVRVIHAQVKPSAAGRAQHDDFHNVPTADDLGCGKSGFGDCLPGADSRHGMRKPHSSARTHPVDEPVDNELRLVIDPESDRLRLSTTAKRGERIGE
jgi:hypothetical protein